MKAKQPITVVGTVPSDSVKEFARDFSVPGTLTNVFASTYVGHQFDLQYSYRLVKQGGPTVNLFDPLDRPFLAGNGENHDVSIRREVDKGDTLKITVKNTDVSGNAYTYQTRVGYDREMGSELLDALAGVL